MDKLLADYFGEGEYRELELGEKIMSTDKFIQDDRLCDASDIGNGHYSSEHFPHYRDIEIKL